MISEFDPNEAEVPAGTLKFHDDSCSGDSYVQDNLEKIDNELLKELALKLSYGNDMYEQRWTNVFGNVGWRKSL